MGNRQLERGAARLHHRPRRSPLHRLPAQRECGLQPQRRRQGPLLGRPRRRAPAAGFAGTGFRHPVHARPCGRSVQIHQRQPRQRRSRSVPRLSVRPRFRALFRKSGTAVRRAVLEGGRQLHRQRNRRGFRERPGRWPARSRIAARERIGRPGEGVRARRPICLRFRPRLYRQLHLLGHQHRFQHRLHR